MPEGTLVFVAPAVSHKLPDVFAAPEAYDPERFAPGRLEDKRPYSLIGFGGGTHRCAGVNFAFLEMNAILTLLLQRYDLELLDKPRPMPGPMTKWPASPCRVRYKLRPLAAAAAGASAVATGRVEPLAPTVAPPAKCPFH